MNLEKSSGTAFEARKASDIQQKERDLGDYNVNSLNKKILSKRDPLHGMTQTTILRNENRRSMRTNSEKSSLHGSPFGKSSTGGGIVVGGDGDDFDY